MSSRVVIFDDLVRQIPSVLLTLEELGAEAVMVNQGREVLPKVKECAPSIVILDVFMPQMSGIELCRQIKDTDSAVPPKVILVCTETSERIAQRALDYGCDLFLLRAEAEAKVIEYLKENLKPVDAGERRTSERIQISGAVTFSFEGGELKGELVNASESGVLFAAKEIIPNGTKGVITFQIAGGESFTLETVVARSVTMKQPIRDLTLAIGAKFDSVPAEHQEKLASLLDFSARRTAKMEPAQFRKILDITINDLTAILRSEGDPLEIRTHVGELGKYEEEAFNSEGPVAECVRRIVLLRTKCAAFSEFVPSFHTEVKKLGPVFFPLLRDLLANIEAIENEVEQSIRPAVADNEAARRGLNETSSRLHEGKLRLMFRVDDAFSLESVLAGDRAILQPIKTRTAEIRALEKPMESSLKYDRRAPPPPPPPKEEVKKKKSALASRPVQIIIIVVASTILGFTVWTRLASRVSSDELKVPLAIEEAVADEEGMKVYTTQLAWERLSEDDRAETFTKLTDYLRARRLHQAFIYNEKNQKVAAISSATQGRKRLYIHRVFTPKTKK